MNKNIENKIVEIEKSSKEMQIELTKSDLSVEKRIWINFENVTITFHPPHYALFGP